MERITRKTNMIAGKMSRIWKQSGLPTINPSNRAVKALKIVMNGIITVGIIVGAGISALELLGAKVAGAFVLGLKNKVSKYRAEKKHENICENIKNHLQINNKYHKEYILEKPSEEKPSEEKLKLIFE